VQWGPPDLSVVGINQTRISVEKGLSSHKITGYHRLANLGPRGLLLACQRVLEGIDEQVPLGFVEGKLLEVLRRRR
jgi:hypothetical protein